MGSLQNWKPCSLTIATHIIKDRVWGLFGDNDAIAHFCPLFLEHYNQAFHFPGGHTPTEQEVKTWYAPLAQKMMMEFSAKEERFIKTI